MNSIQRYVAAAVLCIFLTAPASLSAHQPGRASIHDTVAGIIGRFRDTLSREEMLALTAERALKLLTAEEREALATTHLSFHVNVPVIISVMRDTKSGGEPFWLEGGDYRKTGQTVGTSGREFEVFERKFPAGHVGLGVNSITGAGDHYFVAVAPADPSASLAVTDVYPPLHAVRTLRPLARIFSDGEDVATKVPENLVGQVLIQGVDERAGNARLAGGYRVTDFPASRTPDQVVLTWSGDPRHTQSVQWRTAPGVKAGFVQYLKRSEHNSFQPGRPLRVRAATETLSTPHTINDPVNLRHTARLEGLEPATTYVYSVGDGSRDGWTELAEFTTAPDEVVPFSFIYMGDAQNGLKRWGTLVHNAFRDRPDAAFYVMAGDLVNRGSERDDWDDFFNSAADIYDRRQLVPALGNHEYHNGGPELYLRLFDLPTDGPLGEKTYSFNYGNALFVVLDSNVDPEPQSAWLEEKLSATDATWKFVVYHHPAYSSSPNRNNPWIRKHWGPLFDKYHVDLALQGHDHAYLRTWPMKDGKRVGSAAEGTIYIVSVSGTKFYEQGEFDYTEFGMVKVATWQALDVMIEGNRLVYKSFDIDGKLRDEFVIEK